MFFKNGSWYTSVKENGEFRQRSLGTADEKEAIVREADLKRGLSRGGSLHQKTLTLKEALNFVIQEKVLNENAAGTKDMYVWKAKRLCGFFGPGRDMRTIDHEAVQAFIIFRKEGGLEPFRNKDDEPREPVKLHTIGKELVALRQAIRMAKIKKACEADIDSIMPMGFSTKYKPRKRALTPFEAWNLFAACTTVRQQVYLAFSVATSARHSEILCALVDDIDFDLKQVYLRGTKTSESDRYVPITEMNEPFLRLIAKITPAGHRLIEGSKMTKGRFLNRKSKKLGMEHVTPNDLRRTAATWLVQSGVDLWHVAKVLGHKDTRMVERVYGQLARELGNLITQQLAASPNAQRIILQIQEQAEAQAQRERARTKALTEGPKGRLH